MVATHFQRGLITPCRWRLIAVSLAFICIQFFSSCTKDDINNGPAPDSKLYFPPLQSNIWDTVSPASMNWSQFGLTSLDAYLSSVNTKAFIILKNGKIAHEKYFGTFTSDSLWYWASAGKTMTAFMIGIARESGLLQLSDRSSQYLGQGWTSVPLIKENLITIRHQLTMTSGLDDAVSDPDCTLPSCLIYKADAGTRWAYHNAAYTLLDAVIENASGATFNAFFQQKVRNRIGMNGFWFKSPNANNVLFTNARSMARFGLLLLNEGTWDTTRILRDTAYFNQQINTSQNLNLSYGYLTWLNGKSSCMLPGSQTVFPTAIIPEAPADMYAALGKNDQKIYVVPSQKLVVIRMGNASGTPQFAVSGFDNELWRRLKTIIGY